MKTSVPYSLKKGMAFLGVMALPFAFDGCEKDPVKPNNPNNPDNPQQQKHNVELKFNINDQSHIAMDTIQFYNSDPNVDSIFMIADPYTTLGGSTTSKLQAYVTALRKRHNVNPNKVFGKGDLELKESSVQNNPEIVRFFADTLHYHVTTR